MTAVKYVGLLQKIKPLRQIIQHVERSEDVAGIFIVISKNFMEEIIPHIQNTLPAFFYIKEHPVTELNAEEIGCIKEYHSFLWKKVKAKGHPYRKEIAQSLLLAVFHEVYGMFKNHMPIEVKKSLGFSYRGARSTLQLGMLAFISSSV